jgi:hypothetical protein
VEEIGFAKVEEDVQLNMGKFKCDFTLRLPVLHQTIDVLG